MEIVNFNLRLEEETNDEIVKIAKNEGRSKNKQIEYILKEFIKSYKQSENKIQITEQPFRVQVARTYDGTSRRGTVTDEEMQKIKELPDATDF